MIGDMIPSEMNSPALRQIVDDAEKKKQLTHMQRLATGLLVLACLIFLLTHLLEPRYPWLGWIRATAEAAMIGGLADWFAVTALFRHPLGIPIPHTAIVPNRKDQVGRILGGFVQRHFMSPEVVAVKLRSANVAEHLADWISDEAHARAVARQAAVGLAAIAQATQAESVHELVEGAVARKVEKTQAAPLLGKALSVVMADNRHQEIFDEAIKLLARAVHDNREFVRQRIDQESPWWIPEPLDDKIADKIVKAIDRTLTQLRDDPKHPMRARFDQALREFIERLQTEPKVIARAEAMKRDFLDDDAVRNFVGSLWDDLNEALVRLPNKPESKGLDAVARGIMAFGPAVKDDPELLAKINDWIIEVSAHLVER